MPLHFYFNDVVDLINIRFELSEVNELGSNYDSDENEGRRLKEISDSRAAFKITKTVTELT